MCQFGAGGKVLSPRARYINKLLLFHTKERYARKKEDGDVGVTVVDLKYVVRHIDTRKGHEYTEEKIKLDIKGDMTGAFAGHGGGDGRLVDNFISFIRGGKPSISCTTIEASIYHTRIW